MPRTTRRATRNAAPTAQRRGAGRGLAFELTDATPIYIKLIVAFRRQIETGAWPVGARVPVLDDLASDLGVARATVRQAMGFLEREGLIARARGRGTFVRRAPRHELWYDIPASWQALAEAAEELEDERLELDAPPGGPDPAQAPGATLAASYTVIRHVLRRDGVPYLVGTSYIDRAIVDEVGEAAARSLSVFRLVERAQHLAVTHAEQSLEIATADAETAYLLEVPLNAPIAVVRRSIVDARAVVIYQSEGLFRGDFVRLHRRLA